MHFAFSIPKMLSLDRNGFKPNRVLAEKESVDVDSFNYLGGRLKNEVSSPIQKARLASVSLQRMWRLQNIRLSIINRVYTAAATSVLLCGS